MALPKIKPYTYVDREHSNRVSWPVDPSRAVLLVHDMQVHFVQAFEGAELGESNGNPDAQINVAIKNLRRLIDARSARPPEALMTTFQQAETGFIEALVSIYEPACLPFFEEARARNLRQLNLVIPEKLQSRVVYTRAEALPFFNINFPGELEQARRMAEAAREQRHSTACHASEEGIR